MPELIVVQAEVSSRWEEKALWAEKGYGERSFKTQMRGQSLRCKQLWQDGGLERRGGQALEFCARLRHWEYFF